jgi:BMFP domain-containing protein YqiC
MEQIDPQLILNAMQEQRDRALNDLAFSVARTVSFRHENEALRAKVVELEGRLIDNTKGRGEKHA